MYYRFCIFILSFLFFCYLAKSADLIIPAGQTYKVLKGQTQTFTDAKISGKLIVEANATLNLTGNFIVYQQATEITLDSNSVVNIQLTLFLYGSNLLIKKKSKLTTKGFEGSGASSTKLDGNSLLEITNSQALFYDNASLEINGGSKMVAAGNTSNQGLFLSSYAKLLVDNGSKLEVPNGISYLYSSSIAEISNGSIVSIAKDLVIAFMTVKVTQGGIIELYGNASNSYLGTSIFETGGELRLLGGNQTISEIPEFYNLILKGSGTKTLSGIAPFKIKNKLDLGSRTLVLNNTLDISYTEPDSILRTSGFIMSGPLKRSVNAQSLNKSYLFPIGIEGKYRPVQITPRESKVGSYFVEFKNGAANSLSSKVDQILLLNSQFYHKIYKEGDAPKADISIFYDESTDSFFNRIATWNPSISKWEFLGGPLGTIVSTSIASLNVSLSTINNLNPGSTLFVLAKAEEKPFIPNTYAVLKKQVDAGFSIAIQDTLRFKFEEEYAVENTPVKYTVYNKNHTPITTISSAINENTGDNRFKIYVANVTPGEYALLEVENKKGEKWYLKFKTK